MPDSLKDSKSPGSVEYVEVASSLGFEGANVFGPRSSKLGSRFQMGAFLLTGVVLMLAHHFFYKYLDEKPLNSSMSSVHGFDFSDQSVSSIIGNGIAYVARTVLSAGIGIVFIQVLWWKLRKEEFSVKQIDAMVACRGQAFSPSALPTWHFAFWLAVIAASAALMSLVSILAPGSLRVQPMDYGFSSPCVVQTVSLDKANITSYTATASTKSSPGGLTFGGAPARLMRLSTQVLMRGAALTPFNPCGGACQYFIEFNAPVANCTPVDASFDFSSWLPPPENDTAPIRVWRADTTSPLYVTIATRDLASNSQTAVSCTTYNATYHALITHTNTSNADIDIYQTDVHNEFVSVVNTTLGSQSPEDYAAMQYESVILAFSYILLGEINYNPTSQEFSPNDNLFVAYSSLFEGPSDDAWTWNPDLANLMSSFMQNISVSMLNEQFSKEGNSTIWHDTSCRYSSPAYSYNQTRLLATYSGALALTAVCMFFGFHAIRRNGVEESITFSRILGATLNKSLFDDRYELSRSSQLTAIGSGEGQLRLVHTTYGPS